MIFTLCNFFSDEIKWQLGGPQDARMLPTSHFLIRSSIWLLIVLRHGFIATIIAIVLIKPRPSLQINLCYSNGRISIVKLLVVNMNLTRR